MITFLKELQFLFMPHYWVMNKSYNQEVDEFINFLLDNFEFTSINEYTAEIGGVKLWIANHPYASMTLYGEGALLETYRPSRLTIKKAKQKLDGVQIGKRSRLSQDLDELKTKLK